MGESDGFAVICVNVNMDSSINFTVETRTYEGKNQATGIIMQLAIMIYNFSSDFLLTQLVMTMTM